MNTWNQRYDVSEFYYGKEPNDFLREEAGKIPSRGKVLCLAEGEGRNAVFLAEQGFDVTAVDGSSVGLEKLKQLAKERNVQVKTVVSDLRDYRIEPDSWDAAISIWCHVPPDLRQVLHRNVVAGLRKKGVLILESYRPKQLEYKTGGPPSADLMMSEELLRKELQGLEFVILREVDREIQEGKGHRGMSAVVQLLGVKK